MADRFLLQESIMCQAQFHSMRRRGVWLLTLHQFDREFQLVWASYFNQVPIDRRPYPFLSDLKTEGSAAPLFHICLLHPPPEPRETSHSRSALIL